MSKSHLFQKGNTQGFTTDRDLPLNSPLTIRLNSEQKAKIKQVSNWQEKLRSYIDRMIVEEEEAA